MDERNSRGPLLTNLIERSSRNHTIYIPKAVARKKLNLK